MTPYGLLYVTPDVNLAATGITIPTGTVDALNPLSAVYDGLQNVKTYITPDAGVIDILWDHGAAEQVDIVYLGPTNLAEDAVVHVQRNAADSWGAPSQDLTIAVEQRKDGFSNNAYANLRFDPNTGDDLSNYGNYRYTRIHITNAGSDPISFKEFWLGPAQQLDPNIQWKLRLPRSRIVNIKKNAYGGKFKLDLGVTLRRIIGNVNTSDAGFDQILEMWETVKGEYLPFLVIYDPKKNDGYLCDWPKEFDPTLNMFDDTDIPVEFQELSRGLA